MQFEKESEEEGAQELPATEAAGAGAKVRLLLGLLLRLGLGLLLRLGLGLLLLGLLLGCCWGWGCGWGQARPG